MSWFGAYYQKLPLPFRSNRIKFHKNSKECKIVIYVRTVPECNKNQSHLSTVLLQAAHRFNVGGLIKRNGTRLQRSALVPPPKIQYDKCDDNKEEGGNRHGDIALEYGWLFCLLEEND